MLFTDVPRRGKNQEPNFPAVRGWFSNQISARGRKVQATREKAGVMKSFSGWEVFERFLRGFWERFLRGFWEGFERFLRGFERFLRGFWEGFERFWASKRFQEIVLRLRARSIGSEEAPAVVADRASTLVPWELFCSVNMNRIQSNMRWSQKDCILYHVTMYWTPIIISSLDKNPKLKSACHHEGCGPCKTKGHRWEETPGVRCSGSDLELD